MMYEEENIEPDFLKRIKRNPFKVPENYFESVEDRIMNAVKLEGKRVPISTSAKMFRLLKPVLGLAASLALVFILVYYPITYFSHKEIAQTVTTDTVSADTMDAYSITMSLVDENSLINTILNDEKAVMEEINPDEVLAYLSSDMSEIEIYSETQN